MELPPPRREGLLLGTSALAFYLGFYALFVPAAAQPGFAGAGGPTVSAALGAFGIAALLARPAAGRLSDRLGPGPVLLVGAGLLAAGGAAAWESRSRGADAASRALQGLAYASFSTGLAARVAGAAAPAGRVVALAWSGLPANLAMGLAPTLVHASGARTVATAAGALAVVSGALAALLPAQGTRDPELPRPAMRGDGRGGGQELIGRDPFAPPALAATSGALFAAFTQFASHAVADRASSAFAAYAAGMVFMRLVGVPLARRLAFALPASFVAAAAGLALLVALPPRLAVAAPLLIAAGLAFQHPAVLALHVAATAPSRRGRATGAFYLGFDLGLGAGGAALGVVLGRLGVRAVFALAAALACAGALVAARADLSAGARAAPTR
jgi:MFS family permease